MKSGYNSLAKVIKMEVSIADLSVQDKLNLLSDLMRETGIEEGLVTAFGFANVSTVIETACNAYQKAQFEPKLNKR
jgi:hypothetical protein